MLRRACPGFTLIELMIGIAVVAILLVLGLPQFHIFLQNTQIRNAAETTLSGITLARMEAVRRNATVRFQLVSNLTSGCALSSSSLNWVVSLADPTGACNATPETAPVQIIQTKSAGEGTANVAIATTGGSTIVFNGLGRMVGTGTTVINFSNVKGTCEHVDAVNGKMRCLRILVSFGGHVKMCDPKLPVNNPPVDPRECN